VVAQGVKSREEPGTRGEVGAADPAAAVGPEEEGTGTGELGRRGPDTDADRDAVGGLEDVVCEVRGTDVSVVGGQGGDQILPDHYESGSDDEWAEGIG